MRATIPVPAVTLSAEDQAIELEKQRAAAAQQEELRRREAEWKQKEEEERRQKMELTRKLEEKKRSADMVRLAAEEEKTRVAQEKQLEMDNARKRAEQTEEERQREEREKKEKAEKSGQKAEVDAEEQRRLMAEAELKQKAQEQEVRRQAEALTRGKERQRALRAKREEEKRQRKIVDEYNAKKRQHEEEHFRMKRLQEQVEKERKEKLCIADEEARQRVYVTVGHKRHARKTTKGWKLLCVEWKGRDDLMGTVSRFKESNPVEVTDYAYANSLECEPAIGWWVPYTMKRRNRIIATVNARYHKRTHKFGLEVPKTYEDCLRIDCENGNTMWQDAIRKEMQKVQVAFQVLEGDSKPPPTFQEICCHLVFNIKMEDFQRKARLVTGGHMTESPPPYVTYARLLRLLMTSK